MTIFILFIKRVLTHMPHLIYCIAVDNAALAQLARARDL